MIPARHFAGRAPVTPPTSDSESESKSDSDVEPQRRAPIPRRPRFSARVVEGSEAPKLTSATPENPAKGFVSLKDAQNFTPPEVQRSETQAQLRAQSPLPDRTPRAPSSPSQSSSSQSSKSESERSLSPPPQSPPLPSFKPVFVKPKAKEVPDNSRQHSRVKERKEEAQQLVSSVLKEEEASLRIQRHGDLPDDTDHERDKPREEALWRVREMRRVLREREAGKAWQNRGKVEKLSNGGDNKEKDETDVPLDQGKESGSRKSEERRTSRRTKVGPFFVERDEHGKLTEEIYDRELEEGRGGLSGLRVGRDGGRSGRTKFTGLAREDTAAEMESELRRDRELAATLEAGRQR